MIRRLLLCCCLLLTGCGFHLRGQVSVSNRLSPIQLDRNTADAALMVTLRQALRDAGIQISDNNPRIQLHIIDSQFLQSAAELGSNTQWRRYTLRYEIKYQVLDPKGRERLPIQTVAVMRQFTENPNQLLGSDNERQTLKHEMRLEAVNQLILGLQSNETMQAVTQHTP